jgi:hypothetical protein
VGEGGEEAVQNELPGGVNTSLLPRGGLILHDPLVKLLTLALALVAGAEPSRTVAPAEAEQVLISATSFDDIAVGYAGATPATVHAYRSLLGAADGAERFRTVLKRAAPAGQLYALCGLFFLDPASFDEGLARLRTSGAPLEHMIGCTQSRTTLRDLLAHEEEAPLLSRDITADAWRRGPYPARLDIAGGSTCYRLRFDGVARDSAPARK